MSSVAHSLFNVMQAEKKLEEIINPYNPEPPYLHTRGLLAEK